MSGGCNRIKIFAVRSLPWTTYATRINVVEKAKESSESDKGGIGIKTGDTENVVSYIILMIAVLVAGCMIFVRRRGQ